MLIKSKQDTLKSSRAAVGTIEAARLSNKRFQDERTFQIFYIMSTTVFRRDNLMSKVCMSRYSVSFCCY